MKYEQVWLLARWDRDSGQTCEMRGVLCILGWLGSVERMSSAFHG